MTRISAHDFHNKEAIMACSRIANFINGLHRRVDCRIKTYGAIGSKDVVVNSSWNPHHRNSVFLPKKMGTPKSSVTPDSDKAVKPSIFKMFGSLGPTCFFIEI